MTRRDGFTDHGGGARCPDCGKLCYLTRKAAKRASRRMATPMSAYRCGDFWHNGHMPQIVKTGCLDRRNLTNRTTSRGVA